MGRNLCAPQIFPITLRLAENQHIHRKKRGE
jgi:hypothetical protein